MCVRELEAGRQFTKQKAPLTLDARVLAFDDAECHVCRRDNAHFLPFIPSRSFNRTGFSRVRIRLTLPPTLAPALSEIPQARRCGPRWPKPRRRRATRDRLCPARFFRGSFGSARSP